MRETGGQSQQSSAMSIYGWGENKHHDLHLRWNSSYSAFLLCESKWSIGCNKLCEGLPAGTTIYEDDFPHLPFAWRLEVCLQFKVKASVFLYATAQLSLLLFFCCEELERCSPSFFVNFNEVNELIKKVYRQERER